MTTEAAVPVCGPSNNSANDCQRSINLYPRKIQRQGEKSLVHLVSGPGRLLHVELSYSPIRGMLVMDGRLFVVAGAHVIEVYDDGTTRDWGTIPSTEGRVSMAECVGTISIGDGAKFYSFDPVAATVTPIAAAPKGRVCIAFDQRVFYQEKDSGRVYYSELNDPTNIPALNFFTAENRPDNLETMVATEDKVWLLGTGTAEAWYDAGDTDNPFQRIPGSITANGCLSGDTAVKTDNAVFFVGTSDDGARQVFRIQGFNHLIVSTHAVEAFLKSASNLTAYPYQEDGHTFYVLNADEGTWAFDIGEQEWSERAWLNPESGELERERAEIHAFCYGIHFVADYHNGKLYRQSTDYKDHDGDPFLRRRIFRGPYKDGRGIVIDELFIDMETGVGLDGLGQGTDPKAMLRYSVDGGDAWSNEMQSDLGKIGDRTAKVRFRKLGLGSDWAFMLGVSDPVDVIIKGGTARGRLGRR
jgi:hypothetical protein